MFTVGAARRVMLPVERARAPISQSAPDGPHEKQAHEKQDAALPLPDDDEVVEVRASDVVEPATLGEEDTQRAPFALAADADSAAEGSPAESADGKRRRKKKPGNSSTIPSSDDDFSGPEDLVSVYTEVLRGIENPEGEQCAIETPFVALEMPKGETVLFPGPRGVLNYARRHKVDPDTTLREIGARPESDKLPSRWMSFFEEGTTVGGYLHKHFSELRMATLVFPRKAHVAECVSLGGFIGGLTFLVVVLGFIGIVSGGALGAQGESLGGKVGLWILGAALGIALGLFMANTYRKLLIPKDDAEAATGKNFGAYVAFHPEQAGAAVAGAIIMVILGILALAGILAGRAIGFLVGIVTMSSLPPPPNAKEWLRSSTIGGYTVDEEFNSGLKAVILTIVLPFGIWLYITLR